MCLNGSVLGQPPLRNAIGIIGKISLSTFISAECQAMSVPDISRVEYLYLTNDGRKIFAQVIPDLRGVGAVDN